MCSDINFTEWKNQLVGVTNYVISVNKVCYYGVYPNNDIKNIFKKLKLTLKSKESFSNNYLNVYLGTFLWKRPKHWPTGFFQLKGIEHNAIKMLKYFR